MGLRVLDESAKREREGMEDNGSGRRYFTRMVRVFAFNLKFLSLYILAGENILSQVVHSVEITSIPLISAIKTLQF